MGSLSAAARVLYVAQPALTKCISDLESHLGVKLLTRSTKGVTPTPEGERLCSHAARIFRYIELAEADVRSQPDTPRGKVLIALPLTLSGQLTPILLGTALERYPEISLEISDQLSVATGTLVETGRVDFGLVPNASEFTTIEAEPLYREEMYLIGREPPNTGMSATIRFAELADIPLVLPTRATDIRRRIEQAALAANVKLNTRFEQNSNDAVRAIVSAGLAQTILPWHVFASASDTELRARRIVDPEISRIFSVAWGKLRPLTAAARAVKGLLSEAVVDLQRRGRLRGSGCEAAMG